MWKCWWEGFSWKASDLDNGLRVPIKSKLFGFVGDRGMKL